MPINLSQADITVPTTDQITATVTTEVAFGSVFPVAANQQKIGSRIHVTAHGYLSSDAAVPGNITLNLKIGSTVLCSTGAIALPLGLSSKGFVIEVDIIYCTLGSSGKVMAQGMFIAEGLSLAGFVKGMINTGTTTTGRITVNTTTNQNLGLSAQFSVADTDNIITMTQFIVTNTD